MALVAELEKIRAEIMAINSEAIALCDGLNEDQLGWRENPGRWSIAENLVHLHVTAKTFLPSVEDAIAKARAKNCMSDGPFKLGARGRFFVWYVEPPPLIRLPAPKLLKPMLQGPASDALPTFLRSQQKALNLLEQANGVDLNRTRIQSPLARFIQMDILTILSVFTGHERRHMVQAKAVREKLAGRAS